jgi:energy-coupling factor transport system permease protein
MSKGRSERVGGIPRIKYLDRRSPLDGLNPLPKLLMLIGATIAIFLFQETWQLGAMLLALLLMFPVAKVRMWELRSATRFFLVFSVLLLLIHALFVHEGEVLWEAWLGPLHVQITLGGIILGLNMVIRLLLVVMGSFLFVATTEPNALAHSLMRAGLPYRAGFALVLAIRLMPLMRSESNSVREAQAARGLVLDKGGLGAVVRSVRSTLGPLLVSSLARVDSLVVSMEGRAFGRSKERTFLKDVPWRHVDSALAILAVLLPVVPALLRWDLF